MKHYWHEAACIPDVADHAAGWKVAARLRELRGEEFTGGFVLRRLKKGASVALTSKQRLRHNPLVRKYVHGERVLAQPTTSEWRSP